MLSVFLRLSAPPLVKFKGGKLSVLAVIYGNRLLFRLGYRSNL